jgi:hypothetical protein
MVSDAAFRIGESDGRRYAEGTAVCEISDACVDGIDYDIRQLAFQLDEGIAWRTASKHVKYERQNGR